MTSTPDAGGRPSAAPDAEDLAPAATASAPDASAPAHRGASDTPEIRLVRALSDAAREMHRSLSLGEVVRVATERAQRIVGAEEASTTARTNGDWSSAVTVTAESAGDPRESAGEPRGRLHRPDGPAGGGPAGEVCRTNRPLRFAWVDSPAADAESDEFRRPGAAAGGESRSSGAWVGAPLVGSDGRNLGLIQLSRTAGRPEFTAGDEAVLLQLARIASVAMENARLYQAALDTRSQLAWAAHVERVRAAELRAVINAMGEAVLVCDVAGRVDFVNAAADALFAGRPVATYDDLLSRFRLPDAPRPNPESAPIEVALLDAPERWIELRVYPVPAVEHHPGDGEHAGGRIAVMRDVSAARQARAQREAFLGILSHELRTPITTIYAGSKVLARDEPLGEATSRELATDISAEAERLFRLVEDLLVMTRIERGVLQLAREPVLLQRVAAAAIRLESGHWPATRIRQTGPVDLAAVAGDATYVEQVVRNLLSNAAKYSPPDAEVEVRLEAGGDDEEVICRVLDRGRGFQSDEAEDLFDLFYRSPATAAQAAGAGIGLFVCRRLVTSMGGRIWARPRSGGGAEFGFALRRYVDDA